MEALLAVLIVVAILVLLIIAIGFIVLIYIAVNVYKRCKNTSTTECILRSLIPDDSIKQLTKTVIDNIHTTFKRGIESQKVDPLLPSCYQTQPKPQYEYDNGDSGTDDGLVDIDDEATSSTLATTVSNFEEWMTNNNKSPSDKNFPLSIINDDVMKADKALGQSLRKISSRKNEISRKNDTKAPQPTKKKKGHKILPSYPPSSLPPPLPLTSTSSDEQRDEPHSTLQSKKRKTIKKKSQLMSLPSVPRIETPPVDVPYQSLPDKPHPERTLHAKGSLKGLVSDKPKVKLAIRPTGITPSLPQSLNETPSNPQLPPQCSLPPMIVIQAPAAQQDSSSGAGPSPSPSVAQCTDPSISTITNKCSQVMLPPLRAIPLSGNGAYIYQSLLCYTCPPQSLALAESVVRRDEAASIYDNNNNGQRELDLVKFVPNGITGQTDQEDESSSGDPPSNFPLPELLQSCVPVQSTCSSMSQSTDNTAWEAQQPIAASNLEPPTAALIIAPLTLGVLGELQDEEELVVLPQHDPFQEPPATAASDC